MKTLVNVGIVVAAAAIAVSVSAAMISSGFVVVPLFCGAAAVTISCVIARSICNG